jgi:hypothetical protein
MRPPVSQTPVEDPTLVGMEPREKSELKRPERPHPSSECLHRAAADRWHEMQRSLDDKLNEGLEEVLAKVGPSPRPETSYRPKVGSLVTALRDR